MKTFRLLTAALLLAATVTEVSAQRRHRDYEPTVYMISVHESNPEYDCTDPCDAAEAAAMNRLAAEAAIADYDETWREGFQQVDRPQFLFASKNNRFSFALGGYIALRAGYDFRGSVDNIDMVPYDIPMVTTYATRQRLMMDATTSRVFMKAITNSDVLGRVVVFIDADFHGGDGSDYTPRLRSAFVSVGGFTLGRDVTTFCDLMAAPTTIDFQGPNAYNLNFATMIRYEVPFANDRMKFGIAAEMPRVSGTYGEYFSPLRQRVPDIPAYLQFSWGERMRSHIRLSGVVRNPYLHNVRTGENTSLLGWGAQLSGHIDAGRWLEIFMNGVYGEGITPYIQDLTGSGLDFTPNPENARQIQTMPMWGWQAALQFNLSERMHLAGGYSMVRVEEHNGYYAADEYRQGEYIFANLFYDITPRCQFAAEYLFGARKNMDSQRNTANRVNLMFKYNF